jgi:hypothetical protein
VGESVQPGQRPRLVNGRHVAHELAHVRQDIAGLMQPRPRAPTQVNASAANISTGRPAKQCKQNPRLGNKDGGRGPAGRRPQRQQRPLHSPSCYGSMGRGWAEEIDDNCVKKPVCERLRAEECTVRSCRFSHARPVPKTDGAPCCSRSHRAVDCPLLRR